MHIIVWNVLMADTVTVVTAVVAKVENISNNKYTIPHTGRKALPRDCHVGLVFFLYKNHGVVRYICTSSQLKNCVLG